MKYNSLIEALAASAWMGDKLSFDALLQTVSNTQLRSIAESITGDEVEEDANNTDLRNQIGNAAADNPFVIEHVKSVIYENRAVVDES